MFCLADEAPPIILRSPHIVLYSLKAGHNIKIRAKLLLGSIVSLLSLRSTVVGPRGFGDLGRMAIYFQGAGEQWLLLKGR